MHLNCLCGALTNNPTVQGKRCELLTDIETLTDMETLTEIETLAEIETSTVGTLPVGNKGCHVDLHPKYSLYYTHTQKNY